jgi:uncharacterized protein
VLEHNGDFYACDHFVDGGHLMGNIRERRVADLTSDPRMIRFGRAKRDALPRACLECDVLSFCNGGCPKDRDAEGLNRLCAGYKAFFNHCRPALTALALHMKARKPLGAFRYGG